MEIFDKQTFSCQAPESGDNPERSCLFLRSVPPLPVSFLFPGRGGFLFRLRDPCKLRKVYAMSFAKLFSSITESSLWSEDKSTRLLFVSMLARADATGYIEASIPGLARVSNLTMEETLASLKVLESPDPYSKDLDEHPDNEGRRIIKVKGGWLLVNYESYRVQRGEEERREYMRNYMRDYRKRKQSVKDCKQCKPDVSASKPPLAQAEAEAEAESIVSKDTLVVLPPAKDEKEGNLSESQKVLHELFNRRETTKWTAKERNAWKRATTGKSQEQIAEEVEAIAAYERSVDPQFKVRGLQTLLNKWEVKLDEARQDRTPTGDSEGGADYLKMREFS